MVLINIYLTYLGQLAAWKTSIYQVRARAF